MADDGEKNDERGVGEPAGESGTTTRKRAPRWWLALLLFATGALLAGVALWLWLGGGIHEHRNRWITARLKMGEISKALDLYQVDNNQLPTAAEGLQALITPPAGGPPYLKEKEVPRDPWGEPYLYFNPARSGGTDVELVSKGADRNLGTEDDVRADRERYLTTPTPPPTSAPPP